MKFNYGERRTTNGDDEGEVEDGERDEGQWVGAWGCDSGGCEVETEKNNHKAARKQSKAEEAQAQAKSQNGKGTAPPNAN